MYVVAYALQLLALIFAVGGSALALLQLWQQREDALRLVEKAHWAVTGALLLASALLLHALFWNDFSVKYVADYTDRILPVFYRLTAFWAGQAGSMLFWALSVAIMGTLFACTRAYKNLHGTTRLWYWGFFYALMGFFALVLTTWSNPFVMLDPVPADGNGLNPLLQNPGMIFHPPLLFLGYGGFAVPTCLALAQALSGRPGGEGAWAVVTRPFTMLAWAFLTAGIILGMWWAYMELGWGGYWGWDPVENASLIPWLVGTAALHTMIVEERRHKLGRVNIFLMGLTTVSTFFATFLVRSGVIQSVHAFGSGSVGLPLTVFVLVGLVVVTWVACMAPRRGEALSSLASREGALVLVAWLLLAVSVIILVATMWPVISSLWSQQDVGLEASFYNRVVLPLAAVLVLLLVICPWLGWTGGLRHGARLLVVLMALLGAGAGFYAMGFTLPLPLLTSAAAVACIVGAVLLGAGLFRPGGMGSLGAVGVHLGLALMALGIAFSGPYKMEHDHYFTAGDSIVIDGHTVTLTALVEGNGPGFHYLEGRLEVSRDGRPLGELKPQRRIYDKFGSMQFTEVDVIPGLGKEIYASLLGLDQQGRALVKVSVEPLVNWLWIGGTLMSLFPLCMLWRRRSSGRSEAGKKPETAGEA